MGRGGGMGMQPSIILLKEGTDTSQGKAQLISNINACAAVADIVRTTLGPRGMDKLIHHNGKVHIRNRKHLPLLCACVRRCGCAASRDAGCDGTIHICKRCGTQTPWDVRKLGWVGWFASGFCRGAATVF